MSILQEMSEPASNGDLFAADGHPAGKRWDPLGAPNDQDQDEYDNPKRFDGSSHPSCGSACVHWEKYRTLEEEQDLLSSSLFALTTHFAQVQFRLRQIVEAKTEDKEDLLKSLEEFAFRGIPDVQSVREKIGDTSGLKEALKWNQQNELIEQLKDQLHELEQYAFESGQAGMPQNVILDRQREILQELKARMNLEVDENTYHQLTPEGVKERVDVALGQFVSPLKMKEHLVVQLKTQVADLERFIGYLQADSKNATCACGCSIHSIQKKFKADTAGIVQRTAQLLQMFALLQMGCGPPKFRKNDLKKTMRGNHYGDLRARLELSIERVKDLIKASEMNPYSNQGDYSSDNESPSVLCNVQVTSAVRKYLAPSIRDLIQHGTVAAGQNHNSIVPLIGCFSRRNSQTEEPVHAWEIVLEYYELKNGERFNATPARKLSQSFNLDIAGASATSNKQNMLCAIGSIISTHTRYKRSYDSHFKAFICAALNANKLVTWLNLLFQCRQLINTYYQPWSYVVKTGFQDSLQSLETLNKYKFDLPVDLAIRQFQNIKDVFT